MVPAVLIQKALRPYSWWQLEQASIARSTEHIAHPYLRQIRVDSDTSETYDAILHLIRSHSKTDNDVYLFPNIPIFYLLAGKLPPTKNVVQWFDVVTSDALALDLEYLKSGKARLITAIVVPPFVIEGHQALVGANLLQPHIYKELQSLVLSNQYRLCLAKAQPIPEQWNERVSYDFVVVNGALKVSDLTAALADVDKAQLKVKSGAGAEKKSTYVRLDQSDVLSVMLTDSELGKWLGSNKLFPIRTSRHIVIALCRVE